MARKKTVKSKLTISEFKAWLQGIVEFQEEDWVPNKEQWGLLQEKVAGLTNDYPKQMTPSSGPRNSPPQKEQPNPANRTFIPDGNSEPVASPPQQQPSQVNPNQTVLNTAPPRKVEEPLKDPVSGKILKTHNESFI